jgi:hypothetical protein
MLRQFLGKDSQDNLYRWLNYKKVQYSYCISSRYSPQQGNKSLHQNISPQESQTTYAPNGSIVHIKQKYPWKLDKNTSTP